MTEARATTIHIIGIGSPSGCDALGWMAAERLSESDWARRYSGQGIEITACATPAHLPAMAGSDGLLILIDALLDNGTAGQVRRLRRQDLADATSTSSHGVGVAEALALVEVLTGEALEAAVLGIRSGKSDDNARGLLEQAWPDLLATLDEVITAYLDADRQIPAGNDPVCAY